MYVCMCVCVFVYKFGDETIPTNSTVFHPSLFPFFQMLFQGAVRSTSRLTLPRALGLTTSRRFGTSSAVSFQRSSLILNNEDNKKEADKNKWQQQTIANEFIEAVLYGSKKTKEEDNMTHSKTLARGKYVHELQSTLR